MTVLSEVMGRVEKGRGYDRDLDADCLVALGWELHEVPGLGPRWFTPDGGRTALQADEAPMLTASVDQVVAAIRVALPGWRGDVDFVPFESGDLCGARLFPPDGIVNILGEAHTPARALLAAALRALHSLHGGEKT